MKLLIIGGTQFLGRHVARAALDAGHEVTLFNRGQTNPGLFAGDAETVVGDRDGNLAALRGRTFDACVDPSGYVPRLVEASARLLADSVGHYTFISSISVYEDFVPGMDESAPTAVLEDAMTEVIDDKTYGGLKALCELAAQANMPGRVSSVRSGLIVGSFDPTDRFTYWPIRIARGGRFAAPVSVDVPVQVIDVRDQAQWIVKSAERGLAGVFNVTGRSTTLGAVFDACLAESGRPAAPVWMPADFLAEHDVAPWSDLPLWLPDDMIGMNQVNVDRAFAAGLRTRPLHETVRDILETYDHGRALQAGLPREREAALLAAFDALA